MVRSIVVFILSATAGCSLNPQYSAPWTVRAVTKAYEARDACLAKHAMPYAGTNEKPEVVGRSVSLRCQAETNALIASSNPHSDPAITSAIRQDSNFRAMGYVLKVRGKYHD